MNFVVFLIPNKIVFMPFHLCVPNNSWLLLYEFYSTKGHLNKDIKKALPDSYSQTFFATDWSVFFSCSCNVSFQMVSLFSCCA